MASCNHHVLAARFDTCLRIHRVTTVFVKNDRASTISLACRFMKPAPVFRITNLVDHWQYKAWLTFTDSTAQQCVGEYCHPDSPRPGCWLKGQVLSFSKLKLFSNEKNIPNPPPISLRSFRTYRIQVNVGILDDYGHIISASVVRQSVGHRFIAVTS
ncbi:uncharacterized protein LOC142577892 isoform X2 [Dermacentor variabilis]|uniref:uncharacterized protein LOC142577892 isoform X2 n=1 Tax=Dermacentor variabilis TaxID=34621 RepID=UPI003F5CB4F0